MGLGDLRIPSSHSSPPNTCYYLSRNPLYALFEERRIFERVSKKNGRGGEMFTIFLLHLIREDRK